MLVLAFFAVGAALDDQTVGDVIFIGILFTGTWVIGRLLESRTNQAKQLQREAAILEQEREQRAREAIAEERARIARELHDIVAHGVSTMVLQVGGVRRRLTGDQSGRARRADERRGDRPPLARRDAPDARHHAPGRQRRPAHASARPRSARRACRVDARRRPARRAARRGRGGGAAVGPRPVRLPDHPGGAHQHAQARRARRGRASPSPTGPTRWSSRCSTTAAGPPTATAAGGHGLLGMRERVALFDGRLETGARSEGGYRVHALLPL